MRWFDKKNGPSPEVGCEAVCPIWFRFPFSLIRLCKSDPRFPSILYLCTAPIFCTEMVLDVCRFGVYENKPSPEPDGQTAGLNSESGEAEAKVCWFAFRPRPHSPASRRSPFDASGRKTFSHFSNKPPLWLMSNVVKPSTRKMPSIGGQ